MSLRQKLKTSETLEKDGIEFVLDNTRVTLARAGGKNQKFNAAMERIYSQYGRAIEHNLLGNDQALKMIAYAYAETVIRKWETLVDDEWRVGIEQDDGSLASDTVENRVEYLNEVPDFFTEIRNTATAPKYYLKSLLDGAVKN